MAYAIPFVVQFEFPINFALQVPYEQCSLAPELKFSGFIFSAINLPSRSFRSSRMQAHSVFPFRTNIDEIEKNATLPCRDLNVYINFSWTWLIVDSRG